MSITIRRPRTLETRLLQFAAGIFLWAGAALAQPAPEKEFTGTPAAIYEELIGLDQARHREIRQNVGSKRVTTSLDELKKRYDLSPRSHDCPVYFGQASVQMQFSGSGIFRNASLFEIAAKLKAGEIKPDDVPIQFVWVDGRRVTVNNRSLTALYMAGMRPTKLTDQTGKLPLQGSESLEEDLRRLEAMAGKPSTEMLVRVAGVGSDGRPREAIDWDAPVGAIVSMPDELLGHARICTGPAGK